jgi:hypothetical protein
VDKTFLISIFWGVFLMDLVSGLIVSRRDHGKALVFLTIECNNNNGGTEDNKQDKDSYKELKKESVVTPSTSIQIVLSKRDLSLTNFGKGATFLKSILPLKPGTLLEAEGVLTIDRDSRPSLTASRIKVLRCRADPVSVEQVITAVYDQVYEIEFAACTLLIDNSRLSVALRLYSDAKATIDQKRQDLREFQKGSKHNSKQKQGSRISHQNQQEVSSQSRSDNKNVSSFEKDEGKIRNNDEVVEAEQWCSDDDEEEEEEEEDSALSDRKDDLSHSVVSPRVTFRRELIKIARKLSGLDEDRQPRNRPRKVEVNEMEALERSEAVLRSCGQFRTVNETDASAASIDADVWSSSVISSVHPRMNIPASSLLDGKTGSSDFAQRSQYLEEKKAPQIAWLLRELEKCRNAGETFKHVVDIGGGRADLSLAIASALPTARVSIIDRNAASLDAGRERAEALGLQERVRFFDLDVKDLLLLQDRCSSSEEVQQQHPAIAGVDLFVGLHACGGLTDKIIELAVQHSAAFIVVPCCFCRADPEGVGYAASVACSLVGIPEKDRLALCTLCETSVTEFNRPISVRAMSVLNASRLAWAEKKRQETISTITTTSTISTTTRFKSTLSSFSVSYSPRNQVLISA